MTIHFMGGFDSVQLSRLWGSHYDQAIEPFRSISTSPESLFFFGFAEAGSPDVNRARKARVKPTSKSYRRRVYVFPEWSDALDFDDLITLVLAEAKHLGLLMDFDPGPYDPSSWDTYADRHAPAR